MLTSAAPRRRASSLARSPARLHHEPAVEQLDALAHPHETDALGRRDRIEAAPVILDHRCHAPILPPQDDACMPSLRVLDDIRECLLNNPVQRRLDGAAGDRSSADSTSTSRPVCSPTVAASRSSAGTRPKSSRAFGAQLDREPAHVSATCRRLARGRRDRARALVARRCILDRAQPSRIDVSDWPVSSWSSRASRRRSSSCAATTRLSASRATRCERSTATAARFA